MEEKYQMNKKEKLEHFWEYYKLHTIVVIVLIATAILYFTEKSNEVEVDYTLGIVSPNYISADVIDEMEAKIANYATDINNDGKTEVVINLYQIDYENESDRETMMASTTMLYADMVETVYIYIVDGLNTYSHLLEANFEDVNGELLPSFSKTGVEVDESLYGYDLTDTQLFEGINYYERSIYDIFEDGRVLIVSDSYYQDDEDLKEIYQYNLDLYNAILAN